MTAPTRSPYAAEPWDLHGHAYVGVWLLPQDVAPPAASPATRVVRVLGRTIVSAAFFRYAEPSPLTYDEIMSTVLVRERLRPRVSITHIWVDSEASRAGGRALWAIPKEMADFERESHRSYVATGIGSMRVLRSRRLPFRVPVAFQIAQDRDGELVVSPVAGRARLGLARASWSFDPAGPLAFLAGRRPVLTIAIRPFHLVFGRHEQADPG